MVPPGNSSAVSGVRESSRRASAWETRRERYGPNGHAGYNLRNGVGSSRDVERAALRWIVRLHEEEMLSEGQCCAALDIDRVDFRKMRDSFSGGDTVGGKIAAARRSAGLTQESLAGQLGVTRPQIANIEAGRSNVSVTQLVAFAAALAVRPETLLPSAQDTSARPAMPREDQS